LLNRIALVVERATWFQNCQGKWCCINDRGIFAMQFGRQNSVEKPLGDDLGPPQAQTISRCHTVCEKRDATGRLSGHSAGARMIRLLAVDSEPNVLRAFEKWLQSDTLEIRTAQTELQGLELARYFRPDVVILDLHLPGTGGMNLLDKLWELDAPLPVTLITAYATTAETAVEAMRRGAVDWLLKPVDCFQLRVAVQRGLQRGRPRHVPIVFREIVQSQEDGSIGGQSPAVSGPHRAVAAAASAFSPVPSPAWLANLMDFTQEMLRGGEVDIYRRVCLEMDHVVLGTVLRHVKGNQVKASEMLGISRTTLRAKLRGAKRAGERA
jgi:DNA-binding NtrC family response regulator